MNSSFSHAPLHALAIGVLAFVATFLGSMDGAVAAYDAPRFDRPPLEVDALSLKKQDREEIVSALTALTRNFPEESRIDDDLREKAIGVALVLDPLSGDARDAHTRLQAGRKPASVSYFTSLNAIAGALWRHGERLDSRDSEPEDRRLAPILMEISLLVQPGKPDPEHLRTFQRASELAPVNWNRFLELEPAENPSNARSIALFRPVKAGETEAPASATGDPAPAVGTETKVAVTGDNSPPAMEKGDESKPATMKETGDNTPVSEVKIEEAALTFIAFDRDAARPVGGVASLQVREPTTDEQSLFGLFIETGTDQAFEMRLTYDRDGPAVVGTDRAESLIRRVYPRWPDRRFGEFTFRAPAGQAAPSTVQLGLPALVLLRSAFSGAPVNEAFGPAREFALAGDLQAKGLATLSDKVKVPDFVRAASAMPIPPQTLFLPDGDERAETQLVEAAVAGDLALLLRPQLIAFDSVDALEPLVFGQTPEALSAALKDFVAVQGLSESMEIGAIARNAKVQERLRSIVETWPGHLSARALLAYGVLPEDVGMTVETSRDAIFRAMQPLRTYYTEQITGTGGGLVSQTGELVEDADRDLTALRSKIAPGARDYLTAAERTLEAFETYFSLNNRDSSLGQQRLRELQEQINHMRQAQLDLGLDSPPPGDSED